MQSQKEVWSSDHRNPLAIAKRSVSGLTRTFLSVCCGCNKVPQTGGLNRNVLSQFCRLKVWDQGVGGVNFSCGLWQRLCFMPLLQLLLVGWPSLAFLGLSMSAFIFTWHSLWVFVYVFTFPFSWGHQSHWIIAYCNDLFLTWLLLYSISWKGHILEENIGKTFSDINP